MPFGDVAEDFFDGYKLRLPDSAVFAEYAIDHLKRLLGSKMLVDFNEAVVIKYQNDRLDEGAAPKTINEEVGFLLRILGEPGDIIRARLRKKKMLKLKVRKVIGKAYSEEEKKRMLEEAAKARSPHIYLALTLALNAGMRDAEIKTSELGADQLRQEISGCWPRQDGRRRGPDHSVELGTLRRASRLRRVVQTQVRGDPTGVVCLSVWQTAAHRSYAPRHDPEDGLEQRARERWRHGRWHDNRHTLITELAESGAGDQTIMDIAGHVSKQMLKHYSHIRMEAKRTALESIVRKNGDGKDAAQNERDDSALPESPDYAGF